MTDFYEKSYTILHSFYLYRKIDNKRFTFKLSFKRQTMGDSLSGSPQTQHSQLLKWLCVFLAVSSIWSTPHDTEHMLQEKEGTILILCSLQWVSSDEETGFSLNGVWWWSQSTKYKGFGFWQTLVAWQDFMLFHALFFWSPDPPSGQSTGLVVTETEESSPCKVRVKHQQMNRWSTHHPKENHGCFLRNRVQFCKGKTEILRERHSLLQNRMFQVWRFSSVVEHFPGKLKALGSILSSGGENK